MKKKVQTHKIFRHAAVLMALLLSLCACGSSDSSSRKYAGYEAPMAEEAAENDYATDALYDTASGGTAEMKSVNTTEAAAESAQPQDTSRKLITTVHISAETEEMDKLIAHIENRVAALGGYIEASDISNGNFKTYGDRTRSYRNASMTIRVPAANLPGFVSDVQEQTNIVSQSKNIEDVTLSYTDLESRKRMLKAEEDRLLKFMEQAETIEDMIAVESRLTEVQYQLDSMESQLRTYDNKINYSTVYLSIQEVIEFTVTEEPESVWDEIRTGFMDSLESVGEGLKDFFVWFVTHIPQLVVWAVVIFLIVKIIQVIRRKKLKKLATAAENGTGRALTPKEQSRWEKLAARLGKKNGKKSADKSESQDTDPSQDA